MCDQKRLVSDKVEVTIKLVQNCKLYFNKLRIELRRGVNKTVLSNSIDIIILLFRKYL